MNRRNYRS